MVWYVAKNWIPLQLDAEILHENLFNINSDNESIYNWNERLVMSSANLIAYGSEEMIINEDGNEWRIVSEWIKLSKVIYDNTRQ